MCVYRRVMVTAESWQAANTAAAVSSLGSDLFILGLGPGKNAPKLGHHKNCASLSLNVSNGLLASVYVYMMSLDALTLDPPASVSLSLLVIPFFLLASPELAAMPVIPSRHHPCLCSHPNSVSLDESLEKCPTFQPFTTLTTPS